LKIDLSGTIKGGHPLKKKGGIRKGEVSYVTRLGGPLIRGEEYEFPFKASEKEREVKGSGWGRSYTALKKSSRLFSFRADLKRHWSWNKGHQGKTELISGEKFPGPRYIRPWGGGGTK